MALYIPHSIFHLAQLLYVGPETFGPYYVHGGEKYIQGFWRGNPKERDYLKNLDVDGIIILESIFSR